MTKPIINRNTKPVSHFEALKRLHNCNWTQLAARLGVTTQTLRDWRENGLSETGEIKCQLLFRATLRAANADWLCDLTSP